MSSISSSINLAQSRIEHYNAKIKHLRKDREKQNISERDFQECLKMYEEMVRVYNLVIDDLTR